MKLVIFSLLLVVIVASLAAADGPHQGQHGGRRQGRRQGGGGRRRPQQQAVREGRQQDNFGLGPPPQPQINLPAAPLPLQNPSPANRFIPTGPQPGSPLPPESLVQGNIPDGEGNYNFQFETDDGEFRREEGRSKPIAGGENANEISGEFSWTSPEGELVSFTYIADENGYQAQGSHLPQAPPLHPHIQRGLDLIARANARNKNNN